MKYFRNIFISLLLVIVTDCCLAQESFERQYELDFNSEGHSVVQLPDGGFLIGGYVSESFNGVFAQPTLFRINNKGDLVWAKPIMDKTAASIHRMTITKNGHIICFGPAGFVEDTIGNRAVISMSDSNGILQWSKYLGDTDPVDSRTDGYCINSTADSGFIVAFYVSTVTFDSVNNRGGAYVMKLSSDGDLQWSQVIRISDSVDGMRPNFIQQLNGGSYIMTGPLLNVDTTGTAILKLDVNGNVIWHKAYFQNGLVYNRTSTYLNDGTLMLCGRPFGKYTLSLLKVDTSGEIRWAKELSLPGRLVPTVMTQLHNGNVLISGSMSFFPQQGYKSTVDSMMLLELTPSGQIISSLGMNLINTFSHGFALFPTVDSGFISVGSCSTTVKGAYGDLRKRVLAVKTTPKSEYCNFQNFTIESNIVQYVKLDLQIWDSTGISISSFYPPTKSEFSFTQKDLCQSSSISSLINESIVDYHISPNPILLPSILTIHFNIHKSPSTVTITLHDILGREVLRREMGVQAEGEHDESLDVSELPIGSYIVKISTNGEVLTSRISVVR